MCYLMVDLQCPECMGIGEHISHVRSLQPILGKAFTIIRCVATAEHGAGVTDNV